MEQISESCGVQRGRYGLEVAHVTPYRAASLVLKGTNGAIVGAIERGSPAEKSGMRLGDVIVVIDGKGVDNSTAALNAIAAVAPGKSAPVKVLRRNQEMSLEVRVGKRKPPRRAEAE